MDQDWLPITQGGTSDDKYFRYKMPRLMTKVEGRGNGIKTVLPNIAEVAKALHVDPAFPTKFFGCELGAQTRYMEATGLGQVNGAHDQSVLSELLIKFVEMFVLCPKCKLPELTMSLDKVERQDVITATCHACGYASPFPDQTHRLFTVIVKKLSEKKGGKKGGGGKGKATAPEVVPNVPKPVQKEESHEEGTMVAGEVDLTLAVEDEEVEFFTDTSADAVKQRQMEIAGASQKLVNETVLGAGEPKGKEVVSKEDLAEELQMVVGSLRKKLDDDRAVSEEVQRLKAERGYSEEDVAYVLFAAVFEAPYIDILKEVTKRAKLFVSRNFSEKGQLTIVGAVERLCGVLDTSLLPKVPAFMKMLYDEEIVEEEVFIKWHGKTTKRYSDKKTNKKVRQIADPFVTWLKEAESESDSEED